MQKLLLAFIVSTLTISASARDFYLGGYYNGVLNFFTDSNGKVVVYPAPFGRYVRFGCEAQASRNNHGEDAEVSLAISSNVGVYFGNAVKIDNASKISSGMFLAFVPAGMYAQFDVATSNYNANANFMNCFVQLTNW